MKKIKISTLVVGLLFLSTSTVFASWWNPFTWLFFTKKQNQKIENTISVKDSLRNEKDNKAEEVIKQESVDMADKKESTSSSSVKIEKTGLFISTSTNKLIFTESKKLINYKYKDFRCGGYEPILNCEDNIIKYDLYKGSKIDINGVSYSHVGGEEKKVTQTFDIDIVTFKFAEDFEREVDKIIKSARMTKTTLNSSSNYEEMINGDRSKITPDNPIKFKYFIGQDGKNKYYLVVTRYSGGGDVIGGVGNIYIEQIRR